MHTIGQTLFGAVVVSLGLAGCQSTDTRPASAAVAADTPAGFLTRNAREQGMQTLPGVQYRIVRSGPQGGGHPQRSDNVTVHYEGKLVSGEIFDSSYQRGTPATFSLKQLIPGWVTALQLMRPGDEWTIYVPPEMGYGAQGIGPIPGNSVLIFRVELLSFEPTPKTEQPVK